MCFFVAVIVLLLQPRSLCYYFCRSADRWGNDATNGSRRTWRVNSRRSDARGRTSSLRGHRHTASRCYWASSGIYKAMHTVNRKGPNLDCHHLSSQRERVGNRTQAAGKMLVVRGARGGPLGSRCNGLAGGWFADGLVAKPLFRTVFTTFGQFIIHVAGSKTVLK